MQNLLCFGAENVGEIEPRGRPKLTISSAMTTAVASSQPRERNISSSVGFPFSSSADRAWKKMLRF